jgi:SAM-dependent methyltransferase
MSLGGGWRSEVRIRRAAGTVAWLTALGVPHGGAVLDMGCATGDLSLALSRAGFEVLGVDVSRGMLRRAGRKARGLSRALVHGGWLAVVGKVPGARPSSPPAGAVGARLFLPIKALASLWARRLPEDALHDLAESAGFLGVTTRSAGGRVELSGRAP